MLERAEREGLLDDEAFARLWVTDRLLHRSLSRRAVERELREKGIAPTAAARAIEALYSGEEEKRLALEAARERLGRLRGLPEEARRRRTFAYLLRRGFAADAARTALRAAEREVR